MATKYARFCPSSFQTTNKLLVVQEQLQQLKAEHAAQTLKVSELKDLLAEREKQHLAEMKKK